jgi:hypothetical protein
MVVTVSNQAQKSILAASGGSWLISEASPVVACEAGRRGLGEVFFVYAYGLELCCLRRLDRCVVLEAKEVRNG